MVLEEPGTELVVDWGVGVGMLAGGGGEDIGRGL